MSDRLALTNAIEDAGIERAKAECPSFRLAYNLSIRENKPRTPLHSPAPGAGAG